MHVQDFWPLGAVSASDIRPIATPVPHRGRRYRSGPQIERQVTAHAMRGLHGQGRELLFAAAAVKTA